MLVVVMPAMMILVIPVILAMRTDQANLHRMVMMRNNHMGQEDDVGQEEKCDGNCPFEHKCYSYRQKYMFFLEPVKDFGIFKIADTLMSGFNVFSLFNPP
jgi:hypothetical protein